MSKLVRAVGPLEFVWQTEDPFLFCVHHDDDYPAGNAELGPKASLSGRSLGQDFEIRDGFRMYHGQTVPGFPRHPHRGFETVTLARRGYIDHADSLGATARFGKGDAQWMTAGRGIEHSEMFPLVNEDQRNPAELFQIWLNLPKADKLVEPHFKMLWSEQIPTVQRRDSRGLLAEITLVAGALDDVAPPGPPPSSWASREQAEVAIWAIKLQAGARLDLPPASAAEVRRNLYFFAGPEVTVGEDPFRKHARLSLQSDVPLVLQAGDAEVELLLLQGRPIGEPVAQHGPFVMNTRQEIEQAFADYRRTHFGHWPWSKDDPHHGRGPGRFAKHADGTVEERDPPSSSTTTPPFSADL